MIEIQPVRWGNDCLELLDQRVLPHRYEWRIIPNYREAVSAIQDMVVRGAPAIGVAASYALALASRQLEERPFKDFMGRLTVIGEEISAARPTAVNLRWAINRCLGVASLCSDPLEARRKLLEEAKLIHQEDITSNQALGHHGAVLIPDGGGVLTHCNAGALATAGYGTALGVVRAAWMQGKRFHVFCTETRPWLQGARLTAWELVQMGVPASLIVDSAAGALMARGEIQAVIVGADRIVANGDVANKIGTYSLAVLAKENGVPFYVAAPTSTVDISIASGSQVSIEDRPPEEVTDWAGKRGAAEGISVRNPAFDVTPARYVSAIVTENGVLKGPYEGALRACSSISSPVVTL